MLNRIFLTASSALMAVSLLTLSFPGVANAITNPTALPCERALLIGHRGTTIGVTRNNSLPAFQRAVADGAEVIEFDIHRTKPVNGSGTWVIWHDTSINGKKITDYTYTQLKAAQPDLMTIREAFAYVSTTGRMMETEVKPKNTGDGSFKYFASLVSEYNMQTKFQLSSFDTVNLTRAKANGLKTVYLANTVISPATMKKYANIVHLNKSLVTSKAVVDNFHAAGLSVYIYTSNTTAEWTKYLGYGVDGITTDLAATYTSYCNAQIALKKSV